MPRQTRISKAVTAANRRVGKAVTKKRKIEQMLKVAKKGYRTMKQQQQQAQRQQQQQRQQQRQR